MPTDLTRFYRPVRFLLGDLDPTIRQYADETLANGIRTIIQVNRVPGFTLSDDEDSITPSLVDPNDFALVALHTAKAFVDPDPSSYSYRRRAASESFGNRYEFLTSLACEIHSLENGSMFSGWVHYCNWFNRRCGVSEDLFCLTPSMFVFNPVQNVLWTSDAVLVPGGYLMGSYQFDGTRHISTVRVNGTAGASDTILGLEVNGTITGQQITIAGALNQPVDFTVDVNALVPGGFTVRWKVISGPTPDVAAYGVSLTARVS